MAKAVAILGPGATQADCIATNLFSLMGKKAENAGVDVKRDTFSRDAAGNTSVDVLADSDAGQTIVARDPNAARRATSDRLFPTTKMIENDGKYYVHVVMAPDKGFPKATDNQVEVVNGTDGNPQDAKKVTPVDEILEPTATFTTPDGGGTGGKLVVTAKSSDQFGDDHVVCRSTTRTAARRSTSTRTGRRRSTGSHAAAGRRHGHLEQGRHARRARPPRRERRRDRLDARRAYAGKDVPWPAADGEAVRHRLDGQHRELPLDRPVHGRPRPTRSRRTPRPGRRRPPHFSDADTDTRVGGHAPAPATTATS